VRARRQAAERCLELHDRVVEPPLLRLVVRAVGRGRRVGETGLLGPLEVAEHVGVVEQDRHPLARGREGLQPRGVGVGDLRAQGLVARRLLKRRLRLRREVARVELELLVRELPQLVGGLHPLGPAAAAPS
jgi:hypothetical protein